MQIKTKTIRITHPKLYATLRHYMINKPRNNRTLQDLTAKAQREVGNNAIYGVGGKVSIDPATLTEHIAVAFSIGAQLEDEMFTMTMGQASHVSAVNRNLAGKSLVFTKDTMCKQVIRFALLAKTVTGTTDTTRAVLEHLDELL